MYKKVFQILILIIIMSCSYSIEDLEQAISKNDYKSSLKILNRNPEIISDNKYFVKKAIRQQVLQEENNNIIIEKILSISSENDLEEIDYLYLIKPNNFYLLEILFRDGLNPFDIKIKNISIPYYLEKNDKEIFKLIFINKHIDINTHDDFFLSMIRESDYDTINFLIENGANCNFQIIKNEYIVKSPLIESLKRGNLEIINLIISNIGNFSDIKNVWTNIVSFRKNTNMELVEILWDKGVRDINNLSQALFSASTTYDPVYFEWLLSKGADPYIVDGPDNESPIWYAYKNIKMEYDISSEKKQELYKKCVEINEILDKYKNN